MKFTLKATRKMKNNLIMDFLKKIHFLVTNANAGKNPNPGYSFFRDFTVQPIKARHLL